MRPAPTLDFTLPAALSARAPAEARGLARDGVRLLVSHRSDDRLVHGRFSDLHCFLEAGDLLVLNTSGTLPAALPARRADGTLLRLHLSTRLGGGEWVVELRAPRPGGGSDPNFAGVAGERLALPDGAVAVVDAPHEPDGRGRLWRAALRLPTQWRHYLLNAGEPIRYNYVGAPWPLDAYQTVYATEMGSAEMPSAGRPFTPELLTRLVARGVQVAPLLLHTGVASLEVDETPYPEWYRVPLPTAQLVNRARADGRRVLAVGTTTVRALESVADYTGRVRPGSGWTDLVITPERGVRVVDGLLTGWHEPRATHLAMLEAISGREHLAVAYAEALRERYLWHEFGDSHLLLP